MNTNKLSTPFFNDYSGDWEICETDCRENTVEVYGFDTEEAAVSFILNS